ncbi:amidohydrolase family protein [Actinomadura sp. 9N407]|uniref:amidohydrolase family protein n=1 Tax=Actinomadura sp. 9N407 TaxID=3375154 RepID=UPI0037898A10
MTDFEFVDSHVHFWEPTRHGWYTALRDFAPDLYRDYLPADHVADAAGVHLTGIVHVSATTAPRAFLDETRWLDELHRKTGVPNALLGTIDPHGPFEDIERDLRAQAESPAFRGIRVLAGLDPSAEDTARLFALLGDNGWIFDLVAHPGDVDGFARAIERAPGTTFVLEHTGWPSGEGSEEFRHWQEGVTRLAALPNVDCKLSGLPMALGTMDAARLRPWIETCLDLFGVERCFFGSNFPVDGLAGTYAEMMEAYQKITSQLSVEDRRALFATNARRRYNI